MPVYVRACTNEECRHEFEVYRRIAERLDPAACPRCEATTENVFRPGGAPKTGIFPYVNPHLTGSGPVVVESLAHLRALERRYGVVASAFSQNTSNQIDNIKNLPVYRPGGRGWGE